MFTSNELYKLIIIFNEEILSNLGWNIFKKVKGNFKWNNVWFYTYNCVILIKSGENYEDHFIMILDGHLQMNYFDNLTI
jgi:hypothetical protein